MKANFESCPINTIMVSKNGFLRHPVPERREGRISLHPAAHLKIKVDVKKSLRSFIKGGGGGP